MPIDFNNLPKSIESIYYLANSPSYIYNLMREDSFVTFISELPTPQLIEEFNSRKDKPISTLKEMSIMYALIVALSFKPLSETKDFLESVKLIKFEWFSKLSELIISNYKSPPLIQTATMPNQNIIQNTYTLSNLTIT